MALEFRQPGDSSMVNIGSDPVYVNSDKSKVVSGDSPEAAFMLRDWIPREDAERLGLASKEPADEAPKSGEQRPGPADDSDAGSRTAADGETEANPVRAKVIRGPKD